MLFSRFEVNLADWLDRGGGGVIFVIGKALIDHTSAWKRSG